MTSQGAPPVSTTPVANFSTNFASVVDTGGKFANGVNDTGGTNNGNNYQTADNLKWTWKKIYLQYMLPLLPKGVQKKYKKILIEDFFHLPPVSTTPVANLELRISSQICEKFEMVLMV